MKLYRKLFSFIDEEGNLGYYFYDENTGEEKLFSVVEEEREFANVRYGKKVVKTLLEKSKKGNVTTKDLLRLGKVKGKNSLKAIENPNYDKITKGSYNKMNKLTKGEFGEIVSKPEYMNQARTTSREMALLANKNRLQPKKGDLKSAVDTLNQTFN